MVLQLDRSSQKFLQVAIQGTKAVGEVSDHSPRARVHVYKCTCHLHTLKGAGTDSKLSKLLWLNNLEQTAAVSPAQDFTNQMLMDILH